MTEFFPIPPVQDTDQILSDRITVYRYDPVFETVPKHWMLPLHVLEALFICRYRLPVDDDGDVINPAGCLRQVCELHQGEDVVLIY